MHKLLLIFISLVSPLLAQEAHMVVEAYSGKVISAANSTKKRPVASLTKMATAMVALDWANATGTDISAHMIRVPAIVSQLGTPSPASLSPGDTLTLRDALYCALLSSDNIAALSIAHHVGSRILERRRKEGDPVFAFVAEMNKLSKAILAKNTRFVNTHGLENDPKPGYSTAADMARLSIHAMRRNAISFIVRQPSRKITVNGVSGKRTQTLRNTNELIGEEGILGIKTGTTNAAGPCLATCMDRDPLVRIKHDGSKGVTPRRLIVIVLNSPDRFGRTRKLLRDGWAYYDSWLAAGAPIKNQKREILSTPAPR
ncbi:MAG: D-alanyl-D-alanine carboxypeptidase [Verrucomicrobia bacterium]|jgi:D-alanyl-D-alanine carboxypeptidase (penicillin-binding protein 5/6)|nr:D-alanyl-D-alanine carboxypeptidase [Verrucomicrobiota bacterium]|tara:strand:+ start:4472 stop:5413 length:942 start_codon:yes stop_codon:yes gene_type:complete